MTVKTTSINQFQKQGHLILPHFFKTNEVQALNAFVTDVFKQWKNTQGQATQGKVNMSSLTHPNYFQGAEASRLDFFKLLAHPSLIDIAQGLVSQPLYFHNTQLFFNPDQPKQPPYWHRDLQFSPIEDALQAKCQAELQTLHLRIPLVPETGVVLVPGSHKCWDSKQEREVRFELNGHTYDEPLPKEKFISLNPGDVLIFDAQMLHRGNYTDNPKRWALDLCLSVPHPMLRPFFDPVILPKEKDIDKIGSPEWYLQAFQFAKT